MFIDGERNATRVCIMKLINPLFQVLGITMDMLLPHYPLRRKTETELRILNTLFNSMRRISHGIIVFMAATQLAKSRSLVR